MPVTLHYNTFGQGPAVMILHGLFGSSRNWQGMAKRLADRYQVITVDLRNHGQSASIVTMSYPEMAADVIQLIQDLSLAGVRLVGHSMGGKTAMQAALTAPGIIERLVVLDTAPVSYAHRYGKIFFALRNLPLKEIRNREEAEAMLDEQINDLFLTRFLLQNLVRNEDRFEWRINIKIIEDNIETISGFPEATPGIHYDGPALFLGGANSHFIQAQHYPDILSRFPNATIRLLEGTGHMLHVEQSLEVENSLRAFLETQAL